MKKHGERRPISRRAYLAAGGGTLLAGVSGCLELVSGDAAEFEASPSRASQAALDETGYERTDQSEQEIEDEFEVGGETRDVVVTNVMTEYHKTIDMGPIGDVEGATFSSLTTPQVEILGEQFNPVKDMSAKELAEMVQQQYDGVENLQSQGQTEIAIQGATTQQTKFSGDAAFEGNTVELFLHVSEAVELGDDFVVTVGAYPELTPDEEENILTLMESVEPDES